LFARRIPTSVKAATFIPAFQVSDTIRTVLKRSVERWLIHIILAGGGFWIHAITGNWLWHGSNGDQIASNAS
jgi:hypothetical protein